MRGPRKPRRPIKERSDSDRQPYILRPTSKLDMLWFSLRILPKAGGNVTIVDANGNALDKDALKCIA